LFEAAYYNRPIIASNIQVLKRYGEKITYLLTQKTQMISKKKLIIF
jgi:hypothetical protein